MTQAGADLCVMKHTRDPERPRRAVPGLLLCRGHLGELERLIEELPDRADDMDRPVTGSRSGGGSGNGGGIPIDEDAARHRSHIAGILASWCANVAQDRAVTPPASIDLAVTSRWLLPHVEWCAAQEWAPDMLGEIREATWRALGIADIPARRVPLGERCLVHTGGTRCTGSITMIVRGDDWRAICDTCDEPQDPTGYVRGVKGRGITAAGVIQLAHIYGILCGPDVVNQWHHRKRITGKRVDGVMWYDLGSVHAYLTRRQQGTKAARILGRAA